MVGFLTELKELGGLSPAMWLKKELLQYGYELECVKCSHMLWTNVSRERVWLFGCHADAGGLQAVSHIKRALFACVQQLEQFNYVSKPDIWDIVDADHDLVRLRASQETLCFLCIYTGPWAQGRPPVMTPSS